MSTIFKNFLRVFLFPLLVVQGLWVRATTIRLPEPAGERDDLKLYGYLTKPSKVGLNKPMVVMVHGGPFGVKDEWNYDLDVQFLANRGFSVLQVNFRGSGGRGRDFSVGNYRKMGAEMQDDITDGTQWVIKHGHAQEGNICIYGVSYGGHSAMMGQLRSPIYITVLLHMLEFMISKYKQIKVLRLKVVAGENFSRIHGMHTTVNS